MHFFISKYSEEFKIKVVNAYLLGEGAGTIETALIFGITNQFVKLFRKKFSCHTRFNFVDNFNIHKYLP